MPPSTNQIYASNNSPVKLQAEETKDLRVGDIFHLSVSKTEQDPESSIISLPENTRLAEDDTDNHSQNSIHYNEAKKQIEINWDTMKEDSTTDLPILITDTGDIELIAETENGHDTVDSNRIQFTVQSDDSRNNKEQMTKDDMEDEQADNDEEDNTLTEENKSDKNKAQDTDEKQEGNDTEENALSEKVEESDKNKEQDTEQNSDISKEESESDSSEKESTQVKEEENNVQAESDATVEVNSWSNFLSALENSTVKEIQITADFSTSGTTKQYPVNGDKTIVGNGHTVYFHKHRLGIGANQLEVKDLIIQANQINIAGNANASVFYSGHADGTLILENTSFDGTQHAQVANMKHGHIKIAGKTSFQTEGPFEVFEAKDITFMEGADFLGETTQTGAYRKETVNLYNNPTITVEPNTSVVLKTKGRNAIINELDNSQAVIDIGENAMLQVYADHKKTNNGKPLIHLPGSDASITVGKDATLDIQNHREGNGLGSLLSMHGTLTTHEEGSKVAYWEKGTYSDAPAGEGYTAFPRIMKGDLTFSTDQIISANAGGASSLAESENTDKNGKTFREIFLNKYTSNVKRLHITAADKPQAPEIDILTEKDDTLTGTATPEIDIEIRDASGHIWETTADEQTGDFSIQLGDRAPYEPGDELFSKAIDPYGAESEETTITVVGTTLAFHVPDTLYFQQTVIKDEDMTIPRQDEDWSIDVTDTKGPGSGWEVTAQAEKPLETKNGHQLHEDTLVFVKDDEAQSLKDSVLIQKGETGDNRDTVISWGENEGILLQLNPVAAGVETNTEYATTIEWTLTDAP